MTSATLEDSMAIARKLTRLLRWGVGAVAVGLAVAGCGGGGGADVTPTVTAPAQPDQVAAFALTQQSVAARLAPLAALASLATTGTSGNLIFNGGFESAMAGWVNWGNAAVVTGQGSSGSSALSVGTGAGGVGQDVAAIVPGSTYRLTAQVRVSAASEIVFVGINFLDLSGLPITQNAFPITSTVLATVSFEAVAPPNAVKALVYVWKNAGTGPAYVDDIDFGATVSGAPGAVASGNLLTNTGFETGLLTWTNWGNSASTAEAGAASWAAQVGTGAGGFAQQVAGLVPGNNYRVSALTKVSPGETGYLGVMFMDAAGTALLTQNVVFDWTTYAMAQLDLTAPANATWAQVFVWKNAGAGFAYADEMSLVMVTSGSGTPPPPPPPVIDTTTGPEVAVASPVGSPIFQLPWGGSMSGSVYTFGPNVLRRYSFDGVPVGTAATINIPGNGGGATVLQGGGYAASWIVSVTQWPLMGYQLYTQAYTAAAQPIGSPFAIALTRVAGNNPAAVPHMAPLAGGGYVVVWALQQSEPGGANDGAVYTQRFDANGQPAGPAHQATPDGEGFLHIIGTTTGGYVVSWGKATGTVGGARAYGADGAPLAPEQVAGNSWDIGAGPRGSIAPLAGGGAAIVQQVQNQPVFVQHISASGVALPAQVASSLSLPGRAIVSIAGLPDGGSVVAWLERPVGGVGESAVYARRFAADGTPLGPQTRVNLTTTATHGSEIMVLADGRFMIAWEVGSSRYARTFPAGGLVAP